MPVRISTYEPDYEVVPHAIIWRPIQYFTVVIRDGEDGLDKFFRASFVIGNDIRFDLRVYRGHPGLTVTLYLPENVEDEALISEAIDLVIKEMFIPATAVAWRRGQDFEYGKLERPKEDRLLEPEARILVLKIAAQQPGRAASTRFLKKELSKYIELSATDREKSKSRTREQLWQQIVGNVISHKSVREGPFVQGYATKTPDGIKVTRKGLNYLNNMGFIALSSSDLVG
jgi:hypothetical protein